MCCKTLKAVRLVLRYLLENLNISLLLFHLVTVTYSMPNAYKTHSSSQFEFQFFSSLAGLLKYSACTSQQLSMKFTRRFRLNISEHQTLSFFSSSFYTLFCSHILDIEWGLEPLFHFPDDILKKI